MFQTLVYQYAVTDWEIKKSKILNLIKEDNFVRNDSFLTDRELSAHSYLNSFKDIFSHELEMFKHELGVAEMFLTNVWSAKYETGDFHPIHTHSSTGFSGVLYLNYDEDEHTGTYFVNSQTNPVTDLTDYSLPNVHEGAMVIVPSSVLHFTFPNKSLLTRQIIGFDIKFEKHI